MLRASLAASVSIGNPGDTAAVSGPFGRFTPECFCDARRLVMIAGGIGITPILSVMRTYARSEYHINAVLIWSNRTAADISYADELTRMQAEWPAISVHYVLTHEGELPAGKTAYLDTSAPRELAGAYEDDTHVMLCGPVAMMRNVARTLRRLGYPRSAIHYEQFALQISRYLPAAMRTSRPVAADL